MARKGAVIVRRMFGGKLFDLEDIRWNKQSAEAGKRLFKERGYKVRITMGILPESRGRATAGAKIYRIWIRR